MKKVIIFLLVAVFIYLFVKTSDFVSIDTIKYKLNKQSEIKL